MSPALPAFEGGVVPVVVVDDPGRARDLAQALLAGGIGCAEFALRAPGALDALRVAAEVPGFTAGAGTVLTPDDARACADAGAGFAVSPGLSLDTVEAAHRAGMPMLPGIASPTELQQAVRAGLDAVKVFPIAPLGGIPYLDALAGPFPGVSFMPSGGVGLDDVAAYVAHPTVVAVGGSWIAPRPAIAAGDWERIRDLARATVAALGGARG